MVGKAAGQRGPSGDVAESLVRDVHDAGRDLLDDPGVDTDPIDGGAHREREQVVGSEPGECTAVTAYRGPRPAQYNGM